MGIHEVREDETMALLEAKNWVAHYRSFERYHLLSGLGRGCSSGGDKHCLFLLAMPGFRMVGIKRDRNHVANEL